MLAGVTCGHSLSASIELAAELLRSRLGHEEMLHAVQAALTLGASGHRPSLEMVETLGGSRGAEGALAITLYCALVAADFRGGVLLAVNHSGDSDSTGSMVGNLLGARLGPEALPEEWLQGLQARALVEQVALDLAATVEKGPHDWGWGEERYPGW